MREPFFDLLFLSGHQFATVQQLAVGYNSIQVNTACQIVYSNVEGIFVTDLMVQTSARHIVQFKVNLHKGSPFNLYPRLLMKRIGEYLDRYIIKRNIFYAHQVNGIKIAANFVKSGIVATGAL